MMELTKTVALLLMGLIGFGLCLAEADGGGGIKIWNPSEFSISEEFEYAAKNYEFAAIDAALTRALPKTDELEANLRAAKGILKRSGEKRLEPRDRAFEAALRLFVSLDKTIERCDFASYTILAKNKLATDKLDRQMRVPRIVDEYRRRHSVYCRPQRAKQLEANLAQMNPADLHRVRTILEAIETEHVVSRPESGIRMPISAICEHNLNFVEGQAELAKQIVRLLKDDNRWHSIAAQIDRHTFLSDKLELLVDEYLIEPCKQYLRHTRDVLIPARFDAAIQDDEQGGYLNRLGTAIANYRICKLLCERKEVLERVAREVRIYRVKEHSMDR